MQTALRLINNVGWQLGAVSGNAFRGAFVETARQSRQLPTFLTQQPIDKAADIRLLERGRRRRYTVQLRQILVKACRTTLVVTRNRIGKENWR